MKKGNLITTRRYESPAGTLQLGALDGRLCLCDWQTEKNRDCITGRLRSLLDAELSEGGRSPVLDKASLQLDEYFDGVRTAFDVPLLFAGTDFQKKVWTALLSIPYGQTISYGALARMTGKPKAVRAVANATGTNALSIFVPCHRVIGSDHSLTGYAGGIETKRLLLYLENAILGL